MALTPLNYMPAAHECGDTLSVTLSFGDYPSGSWTAVLSLNIAGTAATSVSGTTSGTGFNFIVPAATTSSMTPGTYQYSIRVTEVATSAKARAAGGSIVLLPNLAGTVTKTSAEQQLDAVNTALITLSSKTKDSVSFNGQSFKIQDISKLHAIKRELTAEVAREKELIAGYMGQSQTRAIAPYFC